MYHPHSISRRKAQAHPASLIPQWNDYYHFNPSSAVWACRLAFAHSLLFREFRYETSD